MNATVNVPIAAMMPINAPYLADLRHLLSQVAGGAQLQSVPPMLRSEPGPLEAAVGGEGVECGRVSGEVEPVRSGWTARLTCDDELVIYCPECDEREFGTE